MILILQNVNANQKYISNLAEDRVVRCTLQISCDFRKFKTKIEY